jgi:hypothetical protein
MKKKYRIECSNMLDLFLSIIKEHENGYICTATDATLNFSTDEGGLTYTYSSKNYYFIKYKNVNPINQLDFHKWFNSYELDKFVKENKIIIEKLSKMKAFL